METYFGTEGVDLNILKNANDTKQKRILVSGVQIACKIVNLAETK